MSWHGMEAALLLTAKAITLVTLFLTAQATAPLETTLKAAHALSIPGLFIQLALLTYRYVFVPRRRAERVYGSLCAFAGYRNRISRHSYRTAGHIAGTLLVRGYERAERVGQAMRCRGFDGQFRSLTTFSSRPADVVAFVLIAASGGAGGVRLVASPVWVIAVSADFAIQVRDLSFAYPDGARRSCRHFLRDRGRRTDRSCWTQWRRQNQPISLPQRCPQAARRFAPSRLPRPRDAAQRRRLPTQVGIVFQNSDDQLFNATVFDDVAFGPLNLELPPDEVRNRVAEALERVGLTGMAERVPFHLSGGEKRRVALAGILAMRPSILLLDEPSMFLDRAAAAS